MIEPRLERKAIRLRYSGILEKCQDIAVIFSSSQLTELFEHAGAAFLEFAERSEDNSIQGDFFEAMGLIQRRRADMERVFRQQINQGFKSFGHLDIAADHLDASDLTDEESELSLVGEDEMEQQVAAEHIIIRANERFFPELFALSQRLAVVNGGRKLKNHQIPAGPHHLVQAFRHSMAGLEIETKIKVILYALFDKFVIRQAKGLYDELNNNLKDGGILPNLKAFQARGKHPKSEDRQRRAGKDSQAAAGTGRWMEAKEPTSLGDELFSSVIQLMSKRPGAAYRKTPTDPVVAAAASHDLVVAVGNIQSGITPDVAHASVAEAAAIPNLEIDTSFLEKVKNVLSRERENILSQVDRNQLPAMDADIIDLIGMLFEYMLNDPVLPNLAKALLSHLHTPYLKVALIDRRLLVDTQHPARRLLDRMVEAGSLWVDEKNSQQGIFPALQGIVDRVLKEFSDDVSLFEELLAKFEQSMKEQQRKTDTLEQRTQETALGREKLRLARRRANHRIRMLLQRSPLPVPVTDFLSKTWLDRLIFILLRDREEDRGDAWQQAVTIAEDLVALFEPKAEARSQGTSTEEIADLRAHLTAGIKSMGSYPHSTSNALFKLLDNPETWQKSLAEAAAAQPQEPSSEEVSEELPAQERSLADQAAVSAPEKQVIERLSKIKFGTWFEFNSATGGPPRRIKLSWLSHLTATCLFVDRSGMQAEIKTLHELAREILSGQAKVIPRPRHPFIERALVSIRNMLQGDEDAAPVRDAPPR